ncbi:MAG: hypothetical protein BalsKO_22770 [Balneolaceae bacterium]
MHTKVPELNVQLPETPDSIKPGPDISVRIFSVSINGLILKSLVIEFSELEFVKAKVVTLNAITNR